MAPCMIGCSTGTATGQVLRVSVDPGRRCVGAALRYCVAARNCVAARVRARCRLWLVPRTHSHRQQPINFTDFVPDGKHDSIQSLVAKINKKIEHRQLKGRFSRTILSVPAVR